MTKSAAVQVEQVDWEYSWGVRALDLKRKELREQQAQIATRRNEWIQSNRYYYDSVARLLRHIVEPGRKVLSVRCQSGFYLTAVKPSRGVGVEISEAMVEVARKTNPDHEYVVSDPESLEINEKFDYILFESVTDTVDVIAALKQLKALSTRRTRLIISSYNHLWEPIVRWAERTGMKVPQLNQSWLSEDDIAQMLEVAGYELVKTYRRVLMPKQVPGLSWLMNNVINRLPLINRLSLVTVLVARPLIASKPASETTVSIIIPCRNEKGNVRPAIERIPELGAGTEILFCDDNSTDGTGDEVRALKKEFPHRDIKLLQGPGINKARNVWTGFNAAKGDVLAILDGDLAVMPEELPYFIDALVEGKGEFINGSRMVYPMQDKAMKIANLIGNKFFSLIFSAILDRPVKDTLCGTKVLWRDDWERIKPLLGSWGIEDRWGDYELLFGAGKRHLKILDLPVHYQDRVYGETKMTGRFRNGLRMLRISLGGFLGLKLVG